MTSEHVAEDGAEESSRSSPLNMSKTALQQERRKKAKAGIAVWHGDIIQDEFWLRRSWILSGRAGSLKLEENGASGNGGLEVRPGLENLMIPDGSNVEHAAKSLV